MARSLLLLLLPFVIYAIFGAHYATALTPESEPAPCGTESQMFTMDEALLIKKISTANQKAETDPALAVIMHQPGMEVFFSSLHPSGALFERPTSRARAEEAHLNMVAALKKANVPFLKVEQVLERLPKEILIQELIDEKHVSYAFEGDEASLAEEDRALLARVYLKKILLEYSPAELVSFFFLRPRVFLRRSDINTPLKTDRVEMHPLGNMVFTRDQQIVTHRGLVLGKLNSDQRIDEPKVMNFFFRALGMHPICTVEGEGRLEGGDYYSLSEEYALIGVGLRTNYQAVMHLLNDDCFGANHVAVVEDTLDQSQDRMHLDTIFNIVDDHTVVILEDVLTDPKKIRLVRVFSRAGPGSRYAPAQERVELGAFLESLGYTLIKVSSEQQLASITNFINLGKTPLGNPTIVSVNKDLAPLLEANEFKGHVEFVDYDGIMRMYGAAHCTTQVFRVHSEDA